MQKINSKWNTDLNIKATTNKEKIIFFNILETTGDDFLNRKQKACDKKSSIPGKQKFIEIKSFIQNNRIFRDRKHTAGFQSQGERMKRKKTGVMKLFENLGTGCTTVVLNSIELYISKWLILRYVKSPE